jgi:hypothetical protein
MRVHSGRTVARGGIAVAASIVWGLASNPASADHLSWMHPYKSEWGGRCCGDVDCIPANVTMGPDGEVMMNGVPFRLPRGSVHLAPDGVETGWSCSHRHAAVSPHCWRSVRHVRGASSCAAGLEPFNFDAHHVFIQALACDGSYPTAGQSLSEAARGRREAGSAPGAAGPRSSACHVQISEGSLKEAGWWSSICSNIC